MTNSPDEPSPPHRRRSRYPGTHPRRFEQRYKELAADQYPEIVPHVLAKGRTPAGQHVPVMVEEIIEVLAPAPGERAVDATLGWGGHAERLLERLAPGGRLLGLDADPLELPRTEARLRKRGLNDGVDLVLADLGVSSMQIDNPARGFAFGAQGPLDMRMNPNRGLAAAAWLERASVEQLTRALRDNADEPFAGAIAAVLFSRRSAIHTTQALAAAVRAALAGTTGEDETDLSVRRVFQALRIEVNDEFGALDALLRELPRCLRPGGRVAVLTFHSGEDRRVKHAFAQGEREAVYGSVAREVVRASARERYENPRSGPAKLRWARRAG
jgi:16S rRNA (cytosine1402-N4)-methyltransferase